MRGRPVAILASIFISVVATANLQGQRKTQHVVLVTLDGARWQEVFGGFDVETLQSSLRKAPGAEAAAEPMTSNPAYQKYWAPTPVERRLKLLPFFWGTLMKQGTIAGNQTLGSRVQVSNAHRFSYPGYAEILTGQAHDDVINS